MLSSPLLFFIGKGDEVFKSGWKINSEGSHNLTVELDLLVDEVFDEDVIFGSILES